MSTDVVLPSQSKPSVAAFVQQMRPEIQRALPKGMDGDRMARLALTVIRQTPKLANCDPQSFMGALLTASALGLEPGTGEAHLVPYGRECTFIADFKGLAKLYWQSPMAQHLDCQAVYANDAFDYEYGLDPYLRHKPARGDRGEVVYYYAVAGLSNGGRHMVVLTPDEVRALRSGKTGPSGNIADPQKWMERKTVLKQLLKLLPRSTRLAQAIAADEQEGSSLKPQDYVDGEVVDETTGEIGGAS